MDMNAINNFNEPCQLNGVVLPGGTSQLKSDGTGIDEKHEALRIQPKAGFVIKTTSLNPAVKPPTQCAQKVFVNVCYHDAIEKMSTKKKLDGNGKEVEGLNLPLAMGPLRNCKDKNGNICQVVDTIIHPSVENDMLDEDYTGSKMDFVCQVLLQCFDKKYKELAPLDRKYKLPRMKYFGYINATSGQIERKLSKNAEICKQYVRDIKSKPRIEEIKRCSPRSNICPDENPIKKLPPLEFHVSLQTTNGNEIQLKEYLADNTSGLINWDGIIPFCLDVCTGEDSRHVISRVNLVASVEELEVASTTVQVSAFALYMTSSKFSRTQCILPFCVDWKKVQCNYHKDKSQLIVSAVVFRNSIYHSADVGTQPWLVTKALSMGDSNKSTKDSIIREQSTLEYLHKNVKEDDDPFHLRSPFPWKNTADIASKRPKNHLPEDQFHSKDTMSQYIMQQQEEERQEKLKKSEEDRKERERDNSIEFVNAQDFKRGGKYCSKNSNISNNIDSEHEKALKNAEAILKKEGSVGSGGISWYTLF